MNKNRPIVTKQTGSCPDEVGVGMDEISEGEEKKE